MKDFVGNLISWWVGLCERHAIVTLVLLALAGLAAAFVVTSYSRINSDLSTLVKPSDDIGWYQSNEAFKDSFPLLQQTAVVLVQGERFEAVDTLTGNLYKSLATDDYFEAVFAPRQDHFLRDHLLYFLGSEDLSNWLKLIEYNFGSVLRLSEDPSLGNAVMTLADHLSANRGLPLSTPLQSLVESFTLNGSPGEVMLFPGFYNSEKASHIDFIVVNAAQLTNQSLPNADIVARLREHVSRMESVPGVSILLTGEVVLAHEEISAALAGVEIAGTISFFVLIVILMLGLGSVRLVVAIFLMLILGVLLTMAFATLAVGSYNTLSLIFVVMFFGLGVDFAAHFLLRVRDDPDHGQGQAFVAAAREIGPALVLCMFTSGIAFLSFTPTDYRGLGELGIISAGGMFVAFFLTVTLFPACRAWLDLHQPMKVMQFPSSFFPRRLTKWWILVPVSLCAILALVPASRLQFDYSVLALRDADSEGMRALSTLQAEGFGTDYSIYLLADNEADARKLKVAAEALPGVGSVNIPADYIPADQSASFEKLQSVKQLYEGLDPVADMVDTIDLSLALEFLAENLAYAHTEDEEKISLFINQLALLDATKRRQVEASLFTSLSTGRRDLETLLSAEPFSQGDLPALFRARLISKDGTQLVQVNPDQALLDREATSQFIEQVERITPHLAGRAVVEWGVGSVVVGAFKEAVTLAGACIFVLLLVYFRSLRLALLVLVPISLTVLFTLAICELSGIGLNMANILVVPLILGLGVDTGIHVVHRFKGGVSTASFYQSSTARAVTISGLTTIGTFFSLSFSPHVGAASVGLLLSIAISLMLLLTFLLLPVLLQMFSPERVNPKST